MALATITETVACDRNPRNGARERRKRASVEAAGRVLNIRYDRLTDLLAQWKSGLSSTLAGDVYPCTLPVDILQSHVHDIAGSQTQAG